MTPPLSADLLVDHSTDLDTLLHLSLSNLSVPPPTSSLASIYYAAFSAQHRLVISLSLPHRFLPPSTRTQSKAGAVAGTRARIRASQPDGSSWQSRFSELDAALSAVYAEAERGKRASGRVLCVVDVFVVGWSVPVQPDGAWRAVYGRAPQSLEGVERQEGCDGGKENVNVDCRTGRGDHDDEDRGEPNKRVALGGTFDRLHGGHKILLTMAAWIAWEEVIVGIADDVLLGKKKHRGLLQPLSERTRLVEQFLAALAPGLKRSLPPLKDVYGPTAAEPDIDALVVSRETLSGADAIDAERLKRGFKGLRRFVIGVMSADGESQESQEGDMKDWKMGSTAIRGWLAEQLAVSSNPVA